MAERLPDAQRRALESLEWGERHFGGLCTNRQVRRRDVLALVALGLAESHGVHPMCDADGWIITPERYAESFGLTNKGRAMIAAMRGEEE